MPPTILVPLDGSPLAARALPYATWLARAAKARIALVRAVQAHVFPGADPTDAEVKVTREAETALGATADELKVQGIEASSHVYFDSAGNALVDAISALQADLVVMSTHGRSGLGRWFYGSVAEHVLGRAQIPVLLIPAACRREWRGDVPGGVLVALDGSPFAEAALEPAARLASWLGGELTLLQVVEPVVPVVTDGSVYVPPFDEEAEAADARQYLQRLVGDKRLGGHPATVAAEIGEAAATIARVADERRVAAIALATHGRTGLARLALGSVAMATVQRADVPLLVVRPIEARVAEPEPAPADDTPRQVSLSASDLRLVELGLESLLRGDAGVADRARAAALLARFRQSEPA